MHWAAVGLCAKDQTDLSERFENSTTVQAGDATKHQT